MTRANVDILAPLKQGRSKSTLPIEDAARIRMLELQVERLGRIIDCLCDSNEQLVSIVKELMEGGE
jgi:hypothetical protein